MSLEPKGVDVLFPHHSFDVADGLLVQFGCGTGVDDVQHSISSAHLFKDGSVDRIRVCAGIQMIVSKRAFPPSASRALEQDELPGHLVMNERIPFHGQDFFAMKRLRACTVAYAMGVPKKASSSSFAAYWKAIIMSRSWVETTPAKAISTNGRLSNQ